MLTSCWCCSLLQGAIIAGIYATLVYSIAFIITVWWIAESEMGIGPAEPVGVVPLPGYLLSIGYLVIIVMSVFMLHGLYKQNEKALLAWLFVMVLFFFPEMGIVLFMSLYHWKISSVYGLTDIIFYTFRAAINLLCLLCVQAQYSNWRDRTAAQLTLKRLESMQMNQFSKNAFAKLPGSLGYHNPGFLNSEAKGMRSNTSLSPPLSAKSNGTVPNKIAQNNLSRSFSSASQFGGYRVPKRGVPNRSGIKDFDPYLQITRGSQSEFNASLYTTPSSVSSLGLYHHHLGIGPIGIPSMPKYPNMRTFAPPIVHPDFTTQSLDRRRYGQRSRCTSPTVEALNLRGPLANYPHLVSYLRPTMESKSSLGAESDDMRKYRDVAL